MPKQSSLINAKYIFKCKTVLQIISVAETVTYLCHQSTGQGPDLEKQPTHCLGKVWYRFNSDTQQLLSHDDKDNV